MTNIVGIKTQTQKMLKDSGGFCNIKSIVDVSRQFYIDSITSIQGSNVSILQTSISQRQIYKFVNEVQTINSLKKMKFFHIYNTPIVVDYIESFSFIPLTSSPSTSSPLVVVVPSIPSIKKVATKKVATRKQPSRSKKGGKTKKH